MKARRTLLELCPHCGCMTWTYVNANASKYCGKCKRNKSSQNLKEVSKQ